MTNITPTLKMIANVGEEMVWEAKIASGSHLVNTADTIDISGSSVISSGDTIKIIGAYNITQGTNTTNMLNYTKSTRKFAFKGGSAGTNFDAKLLSADEVRIEFKNMHGSN